MFISATKPIYKMFLNIIQKCVCIQVSLKAALCIFITVVYTSVMNIVLFILREHSVGMMEHGAVLSLKILQ